MTEIPEHLLKRSRERRSAIGQGGDSEAPAADAAKPPRRPRCQPLPPAPRGDRPVGTHRCAGRAPAAPPVKPDPPYVVAAKQRRKKIPFWAMATLSLMPDLGVHLRPCADRRSRRHRGPLGDGVEVYSNCAGCHGADGGGGVGYAFTDGEVLATFPHIADQIR